MLSVRRVWFYFRLGHGTYLGLFIGLAQFLVIAYVLFLTRFPGLSGYRFRDFALGFSILYSLSCVLVGYVHKRWQMTTETDIATISNPYIYRVTPGKEQRVLVPINIFNLEVGKVMMEKLGALTPELAAKYDYWIDVMKRLASGEEFA